MSAEHEGLNEPVQPPSPAEVFAAGVKQRLAALPPGTDFSFSAFADLVLDPDLRKALVNMRPLEKRGTAICRIENAVGIPFELYAFGEYWLNGRSLDKIAKQNQVSRHVVVKAMTDAGIPHRKRKEAVRMMWQDPERKQAIIAQWHTPAAKANRGASVERWRREHPEESRQMMQAVHEASARNRDQRIFKALGLYPELTLYRLHYEEGYSVAEISSRTGLPERNVRGLFFKYGIKNLDVKYQRAVEPMRAVHEILPEIYINPDRMLQLTPPEQHVIFRRFIEPEYETSTLEEVGSEMGVTKERVRQIQEDALNALRRYNPSRRMQMERETKSNQHAVRVFQYPDD